MSRPPVHPQLGADCHVLGRLRSGALLLNRNAALPWFLLVPEGDAVELHDLPPAVRRRLESDQDGLARFVLRRFACDKLNVAAIGNVVPQLHVHVIGRYRDDPCWPGVVWGRLPAGPIYPDDELAALSLALTEELGLRR